jgi:hypothetical protein
MAIPPEILNEIQQINSAVSQYFSSINQSQGYYENSSNNVNALQGQLDDKRLGVGNSDTSITATIIADQQTELDRKLAEVEMLKDQLTIMDVKIDRSDVLIQNIDKEIIPLVDEINVAITSVKTAYDARITAGCKSDLSWQETSRRTYTIFLGATTTQITTITYTVLKNPSVREDYNYYGAKYYRKPQNQDYGANIVKEFLGTISIGSTSLAILSDDGTSDLQVGDTITDNVDNPTVFSSANLPSIVGFGTTVIVGTSTQFGGTISSGSTIIAHTGIGTTGNINIGDTISLSGVLALNTTVVGIGTTTITLTDVWDPDANGPASGAFISTTGVANSLIVSVAAIGSTTNGSFTVGILSAFPSVILSGASIEEATNTNFTCIRTTQTDSIIFDSSNNPIDPVTIGIMGNNTLGLGHKLVRVNNGSPIGPFQWSEVMTSSFADKTDAQLNEDEKYLRETYPEPPCGASFARYYPGNLSWPTKETFTYDLGGFSVGLPVETYANEGDTVTISSGTSLFGIGTTNTSENNPTFSGCTSLDNAITAAEISRDAIIARNTPKIDSLIASASALRSIRDNMEGQAFSILQGRVFGDVEINKLKTELAALRAVDLKQFEPQAYYFNPDTGKTSSSTVGVATV